MKSDPAAKSARNRLSATETIAIQMNCVAVAVRAILATHPDPGGARLIFDQLIAQMLVHPDFLADADRALILRDMAEALWQPLVELDK